MRIIFKTKQLETCSTTLREATKLWGPQVARKYIQRITIIRSSANLDQLKQQRVLRCHPLKGDRQGQWSITLHDRYRLIFTLQDESLEVIQIEEVSNHYDD